MIIFFFVGCYHQEDRSWILDTGFVNPRSVRYDFYELTREFVLSRNFIKVEVWHQTGENDGRWSRRNDNPRQHPNSSSRQITVFGCCWRSKGLVEVVAYELSYTTCILANHQGDLCFSCR
jgi:hypothetical protein